MVGTLYVVSKTGEQLVFDPNGLFFKAVPAPGEGHSTVVVKTKAKPKPTPPPKPIEAKGTLPDKPVDIDMSFVGGLPVELKEHDLWLATGAAAPGIPSIKGAVTLDHLKTWARAIPKGQHHVLILEPDDGE